MRRDDLLTPPADLRVPEDNGAARHLLGLNPPPLVLTATAGRRIRLDLISSPTPPRGGENSALVPGVWGSARCAFRDHHAELAGAGAGASSLSTQDTAYQQEMVERLHLPFSALSEAGPELTRARPGCPPSR